jgi:selenium metabolism protein YedF
MEKLDLREHQCPYPVVQTRKAMLDTPGILLSVLVGDDVARDNIQRLAESMGYTVDIDETDGGFSLQLKPENKQQAATEASPVSGKTVTFLTADSMGKGDDELGRILMKNYLFTLTEMERVPDKMLLVNAAVKLACEGSDALEALDKIACMGVDIASCGLCLEFFDLKDQLKVGRTTNMLEVAESLQTAGRIIRM